MKFSDEIVTKIVELVKNGTPNRDAAQIAGVDESTFYRWKKENPGFKRALREATSWRVAYLAGQVMTASRKDWRAACWLLSCYRPDIFGHRDQDYEDRLQKIEQALEKMDRSKHAEKL